MVQQKYLFFGQWYRQTDRYTDWETEIGWQMHLKRASRKVYIIIQLIEIHNVKKETSRNLNSFNYFYLQKEFHVLSHIFNLMVKEPSVRRQSQSCTMNFNPWGRTSFCCLVRGRRKQTLQHFLQFVWC